jgi:hypothetical protein
MDNLCEECMQVFSSIKKLRRHLKEQHADEIPSFVCKVCSQSFKRAEGLKRHYTAKHLDQKFDCMVCSARFIEKYKLKRHYKHNHQLIYCTRCEIVLVENDSNSNSHTSSLDHNSRKASIISYENENNGRMETFDSKSPHKCKEVLHSCPYDKCDKRYKRKAVLDQHISITHTKVDKFIVCPIEEVSHKNLLRDQTPTSHSSLNLKSGFFKSQNYSKTKVEAPDDLLATLISRKRQRMKYMCSHGDCLKVLPDFGRYKSHLHSHANKKEGQL